VIGGARARHPPPLEVIEMSEDRLTLNESQAHAYARESGVSRVLYPSVRACAMVVLRLWFRLRVSGVDHIPAQGPAIIAPNHKNLLDPFFVAIVTRRHVRFMAKVELFRGPLAWLLPRLGAFPVRRGGADAEALATARSILSAGGAVVVFAEGTRVQEADVLGSPHHGAGRLALETGAPIVPAAISGTSHLWRGALPRLKRVHLAFLPVVVPDRSGSRDELVELIDRQVWPAVKQEYGRLRRSPGLLAGGLAALGLGGGLLVRRRIGPRSGRRLLGKVEPRTPRRGTTRRPHDEPVRNRR
jgi:1-acyl-sn-glycerol-3-phosphate acyltransferase